MSYKRVKSVAGALNDEDENFEEDYDEEEERELAIYYMADCNIRTNVSRDEPRRQRYGDTVRLSAALI
jgi:hypothetical protein